MDCTKRDEPPYVCNGCQRKRHCNHKKHYYYARTADEEALSLRSEARIGFNLTEEEAKAIEEHLKPLIVDGGFSPHAAIVALGEETLGCSERTIYTYIDNGVFKDIINLDLPLKVRYRPRKGVKKQLKVDKKCRIGRDYVDYKDFIASKGWEEMDAPIVQMDTV